MLVSHEYALDDVVILQDKKIFFRTIQFARQDLFDLKRIDLMVFCQPVFQGCGHIFHRIKRICAFLMHPLIDLVRPVLLFAKSGDQSMQL